MKIPIPPILFVFLIILSFLLKIFFPIYTIPTIYPFSIIFLITGIFFILDAIYLIYKNKTTIDPSETPSKLIEKGVFSISRNPIYLGMLFILFSTDIYLSSLSSFINLFIFFYIINNFVIKMEEKNIEKKFKKIYIDYKNNVKKWI